MHVSDWLGKGNKASLDACPPQLNQSGGKSELSSTKFELYPIRGLSSNVWKLQDQSEARKQG